MNESRFFVNVLLFAQGSDIAGSRNVSIEAANVGELRIELANKYGPEMIALLGVSPIWVNRKQATGDDQVLNAADEVALIPPVSGG